MDEADAEDAAIIQAEAEEAGQAPPVTAPVSTATPSSLPPPAFVLPSSAAATSVPHVTAGGAIPKRPPPGLPAPPTSVQDTNAPSVLLTGAGSRDAGTTVMDTVLPGPAPAGGVSVSKPAPGYHPGYHFGYGHGINSLRGAEGSGMDIQDSAYQPTYATVSAPPASIGYFPEGSRYLPTVAPMDTSRSHPHPVATAREQPPGNSAPCTDTRSDSTGPCNDQLAQLIGVLQAPAVIIPTFSGDPMSYQRFIRAFEDNVERVISDDASRLARLAQQCEARLHASSSAAC